MGRSVTYNYPVTWMHIIYFISSTGSVTFNGKTVMSGDAAIAANDAITVRANLSQCSGSISLLADSDNDGVGQIYAREGASIAALGSGSVSIDGSGVMTFKRYDYSGRWGYFDRKMRAPSMIISNNSLFSSNNMVSVSGGAIENITTNAPKVEFYKTQDTFYIEKVNEINDFINIEGDGINVTYLKTANVTLKTDGLLDTNPGVILNAPTLTLIADRFGTNVHSDRGK